MISEREVELGDRAAGDELGAQLALAGVLERRIDPDQRGEDAVEAQPGLRQRVLHRVRIRGRQALAGERADRVPQHIGEIDDAGEQRRVVDDAPHDPGERHETPRGKLDADGVAHHVLDDMGLVEDHHVVLGQDRTIAADVEAVEMGVDDDDVGRCRSPARPLGETRLAHRAPLGAGALLAADAH